MKKIIIAGSAGVGKSTLGRELSKTLLMPHIELDHLFWLCNWRSRSESERRKIAKEKTASLSEWILCGNHFYLDEITFGKADTVIWLDYPLRISLWGVFKRALKSIVKKEKIVGCNIEKVSRLFSFRGSILIYTVKHYKKTKKRYVNMMHSSKYKHLNFICLRSPREMREWVKRIEKKKFMNEQNERMLWKKNASS